MDEATLLDCAGLDAFKDFGEYMKLLRNRTDFNETLLLQCQRPICSALWGFGVPDISGIGVAVGYILETVIAVLLALLIVLSTAQPSSRPLLNRLLQPLQSASFRTILPAGLSAFFESAIYFALAIQVATIAILAPKDFAAKVTSFGDYEARTAAVVSILCLLPLLYPVPILASSYFIQSDAVHARKGYRLSLFCLTVLASVYPFFSQCVRNWSRTQVGEGSGDGGDTYVYVEEWSALHTVCFGGIEYLTEMESNIIGAFLFISYLVIFLFTLAALTTPVLHRLDHLRGNGSPLRASLSGFCAGVARRCETNATVKGILLTVPISLSIPVLWGFWRLRAVQEQLAHTTGSVYEGNDWGFGQVVAIAIFVPVGAEMIFVYSRGSTRGAGGGLNASPQEARREENRSIDWESTLELHPQRAVTIKDSATNSRLSAHF